MHNVHRVSITVSQIIMRMERDILPQMLPSVTLRCSKAEQPADAAEDLASRC
jgi:hypothetical protein